MIEPVVTVHKVGGTSSGTEERIEESIAGIRGYGGIPIVMPSASAIKGFRVTQELREYCRFYNHSALEAGIRYARIVEHHAKLAAALINNSRFVTEQFQEWRGNPQWGSDEYILSLGESMMALLYAKCMKLPYFDAADVIALREIGGKIHIDIGETRRRLSDLLPQIVAAGGACIPPFYGFLPGGCVCTLGENSSDLSSTSAAAALGVPCIIWTDVIGICLADPRIVENPLQQKGLSFDEMGELAHLGTKLHPKAVAPAEDAGITITIRSPRTPDNPGTVIGPREKVATLRQPNRIAGIAGRGGSVGYTILMRGMDNAVGYLEEILGILREGNVPVHHLPTGTDVVDLVIPKCEGPIDLVPALKAELQLPSLTGRRRVTTHDDLAEVWLVGHDIGDIPEIQGRIRRRLDGRGIKIRMFIQGLNNLTIVIGVHEDDLSEAIRALHREFAC